MGTLTRPMMERFSREDMKCVGMQHLEAVRRLKAAGKSFPRTLHLSFVPDEEVGGVKGMKPFITSKSLEPFNVGFVLDEGLASGMSIIIISGLVKPQAGADRGL